jgi:predicted AAA+ superfamily ATPase
MLLRSVIEDVYVSQKEHLSTLQLGLERELRGKIELDSDLVTIITGIRRSGKSTLLRQIINSRVENCCFMNFEDPRLAGFELGDFNKLDNIFPSEEDDSFYFFDEIQNVPGWERFIRNKQDFGKKIVITGSNASLLSRELGTYLTGRHIDYELFPFSYKEFLKFNNSKPGAESFQAYLDLGGFPEYLKYTNPEILFKLADDIVYRDIVVRYGIKNHNRLKQLLLYLLTNNGKLFSYNNLKKLFSLGSSNTIIDYISFFENAYLLFTIPKFSYSYKKQLYNPKKVYSVDTGLTSALSLSFSKDSGRKLENAVFLHLRKGFHSIYYFSEGNECDFLLMNKGKVVDAIQVCYDLNTDNLDREINGLTEAMQKTGLNEGTIITFDQDDFFEKNGNKINVIPAWKYMTA